MNEKSKKMWQLATILAINLALLVVISAFNAEAAKLGDSGERIAKIQNILKEKDIFLGETNGVFCFKTRKGIAEYQSLNNIEKNGEADIRTLRALGLDSHYSDCFSARTELLARCIQLSGCRTYHEMLKKGYEILESADSAVTLGKYIAINFPEFKKISDEPSDSAYSAAIQAIRKTTL